MAIIQKRCGNCGYGTDKRRKVLLDKEMSCTRIKIPTGDGYATTLSTSKCGHWKPKGDTRK